MPGAARGVYALLVGGCATGIIYTATGADVGYGDLWLYVAICSLTFQALVLGSLDLFGMAGMIVPVVLLIIGMDIAYLPAEFLPAFYQDFVYPWDLLRFMADGYRGILYLGQDFWNLSSQTLMIVVALGAAMMLGSAFVCGRRRGAGDAGNTLGHRRMPRRRPAREMPPDGPPL